jgi:hypothetical protein
VTDDRPAKSAAVSERRGVGPGLSGRRDGVGPTAGSPMPAARDRRRFGAQIGNSCSGATVSTKNRVYRCTVAFAQAPGRRRLRAHRGRAGRGHRVALAVPGPPTLHTDFALAEFAPHWWPLEEPREPEAPREPKGTDGDGEESEAPGGDRALTGRGSSRCVTGSPGCCPLRCRSVQGL